MRLKNHFALISDFWKKKIGISNPKVSISELLESFLGHIEDDIKAYKQLNRHFHERMLNSHSQLQEVALGRFVSNNWNSNGDDWLTVYELNANTEGYGKDIDLIKITSNQICALEKLFMSQLLFYPLTVDAGMHSW
jgi:hypothetical protein